MAAEAAGPPVVAEIADLLDQCTPEELSNILATIEGGGCLSAPEPVAAAAGPAAPAQAATSAAPLAPVPPPAPPPGAARRPPPAGVKRVEAGGGAAAGEAAAISMDDLKRILQEHSAGVLSEVRKLMPVASAPALSMVPALHGVETIDMGVLTQALVERDREVRQLEARLAGLQTELAMKDQRVAELGGELDLTVREVRHRQLDLEFQQLKLEERVRSNAELEQAQRSLSARVEEASLSARHAALDLDLCRSTPRSIRAQGTLPWTLRKNRPGTLPAVGGPVDGAPH